MPAADPGDKVDYGQIGPVILAIFSNFFGSLVIFPFVPFMVKDFLDVSRTQIGFYSGFLISSYHVGAFFGSLLWGTLADKWGRRPTMLTSMACMLVCMLFFGFSQNFAWAVAARLLWGFSGAIVSVGKTLLSESSTNANTARVFSFMGVSGGMGRLVGPAAGGLLSQPAQKFPALDVPFFRKFPYILPIFLGFFVMLVALMWSVLRLRETLHRPHTTASSSEDNEANTERIELLPVESPDNTGEVETQRNSAAESHSEPRKVSLWNRLFSCLPCRKTSRSGFQRMTDNEDSESGNSSSARSTCMRVFTTGVRDYFASFGLLRDKVIRHSCTLYAALAFEAIMHNEIIPLLLVVSYVHGGLCMNSAEIGILTAAFGLGHLIVQLFFYPRLAKRFGYRKVFRGGLCGFLAFMLLMPWLTSFTGNQDPLLVYDIDPAVRNSTGDLYSNDSSWLDYANGSIVSTNLYRPTTASFLDNSSSSIPEACKRHVLSTFNSTASACGNSEASVGKNVTSSSAFQFNVVPCLPYYVWLISWVVVGGGYLTRTVSFTSINVIINNSCEREVRARVNGIGMVVSSLGRIVGPLLVSNVFAWSVSNSNHHPFPLNHHLSFLMVSLIIVFTLVWSWGLPESVESRKGSSKTTGSQSASASNGGSGVSSITSNGNAGHAAVEIRRTGESLDDEENETKV